MSFESQIIKLMKYSRNTYYVWKREKRPIISLLEKYFSENDIKEFLDTGKVSKFEKGNFLLKEIYEKKKVAYLDLFHIKSLRNCNTDFQIFYFKFLRELKQASTNTSKLDNWLFNKYFFIAPFNQLINTFLIAYLDDLDFKHKMTKTYIIYKDFDIFDSWDSYMLLFIKECIDNNFKNLYEPFEGGISYLSSMQEIIYHISGFYIFTDIKFEKLQDMEKIELLSKTFTMQEKKLTSVQPSKISIDDILDNLFADISW